MSAPQETFADPVGGLSLDQFPTNQDALYQVVVEHVEEVSTDIEDEEEKRHISLYTPGPHPPVLNPQASDESVEFEGPYNSASLQPGAPPPYQGLIPETLDSLPSPSRHCIPSGRCRRMPAEGVPRPGPAKLGPKAGLDEWLEEAKQCHYLPENVMKQLCESVKECLMEGKFICLVYVRSLLKNMNRIKYSACTNPRNNMRGYPWAVLRSPRTVQSCRWDAGGNQRSTTNYYAKCDQF